VTNAPGTYNATIQIYDAVGNLVREFSIKNYVITDPTQKLAQVLQTWDVLNSNNRFVGSGTYLAKLKMTNVSTGSTFSKNINLGVQANGSESWIADYGVTKIIDQFGDKIYRFPAKNQTTKKAIIYFKGWDPLNIGDGANMCFSRLPLFNGEGSERYSGWDIYFVAWQDAGISLRINVDRMIYIVNKLNSDYGSYSQFVLIGFSMGGVLGRYALAKAETNGAPLPITKFISVEGEQQGAHINLTFQASVTHLVIQPDPPVAAKIGSFLGLLADAQIYKDMLYSASAKEMLYYHVGLVENYFDPYFCVYSTSYPYTSCPAPDGMEGCVFNISKLDEIRSKADDWHDSFYGELRSLGKCQGGYPSYSKNYAISLGTAQLEYSADKGPNQLMGTMNAVFKYKIFSDFQDVDQGAIVDLASNAQYTPSNGYGKYLNFVRLESAFDLQQIDFAKQNGRLVKELTQDELQKHSRFDKIYLRPNGLRQDHGTFWDDIVWSYIRDALNDNTPKGTCKIFGPIGPAVQLLLDD
jgi:hypothetical protein